MAIEYFGNNTTGDGSDSGWGGCYICNKPAEVWTCPGTGKMNLKELGCYNNTTGHTRMAIYDTSGNFVFQGEENTTDQSSLGWHSVTAFQDVALAPVVDPQLDGGTDYVLILGYGAAATSTLKYTTGSSGDSEYGVTDYSDGFPATFNLTLTDRTWIPCIRCGVTAAAGGGATSGTVTDTLAILDSPSNTYIGVVAKIEAGNALDIPSNTYIGVVSKTEAASASDSAVGTFIGVVSGIELASLSDSPSNTMIGRVAAAESANAQDTPSVTYIAVVTNSETISAIDVPGASYIGRVSLAELASAIDASDWKVEWSVSVVEAGVAVDSPSNTFIGRSAILEAMTAQDTPSSTYIGLVAALESVGATDAFSFIAADIWAVSVTESMTVKDICSAILSSYVEEETYRPFRKHWHFHPVLRDGEMGRRSSHLVEILSGGTKWQCS